MYLYVLFAGNYKFPTSTYIFFRPADFHAYHHSHNVGNFGMLRLWDSLMGTDASYCENARQKETAKTK